MFIANTISSCTPSLKHCPCSIHHFIELGCENLTTLVYFHRRNIYSYNSEGKKKERKKGFQSNVHTVSYSLAQ